MADYTLTPASVQPSAQAVITQGTFGATVTAGQPVYQDAADLDYRSRGKWKLADANGSATTAAVLGIAANSGSNNQPANIVTYDPDFTHGLTTVATGDIIIASGTAGAQAPAADLASTWYPIVTQLAISATKSICRPFYGTAPKA